jgi:hypothetical protein
LFILAILAITLGTAMGAAELFGVSLALGAFVAGVVVSESPLSHQVGADVFPIPRGVRGAVLRLDWDARKSRLSSQQHGSGAGADRC